MTPRIEHLAEGVSHDDAIGDALAAMRRKLDADIWVAFGMPAATVSATRDSPALTAQSLLATMKAIPRVPDPVRFVFTANALKESTERLFPASRHRSARIRKKLIKRHGGEFRMKPVMWKVGNVIYAHSAFERDIRATVTVAL